MKDVVGCFFDQVEVKEENKKIIQFLFDLSEVEKMTKQGLAYFWREF